MKPTQKQINFIKVMESYLYPYYYFEDDILFKEKRFLCKYLIRKGANVNYKSIMRDCFDEFDYSTALDSVLGSISFWECSTAFENDIKTKKATKSITVYSLKYK